LQEEDDDVILDVGYDQSRIQFCFLNLKQRLLYEREQNYKLQGMQVPTQVPQLLNQKQLPKSEQVQSSQLQKLPQSPVKRVSQSQPQLPQETAKSKACAIM